MKSLVGVCEAGREEGPLEIHAEDGGSRLGGELGIHGVTGETRRNFFLGVVSCPLLK